jgi:hypothetical protein
MFNALILSVDLTMLYEAAGATISQDISRANDDIAKIGAQRHVKLSFHMAEKRDPRLD